MIETIGEDQAGAPAVELSQVPFFPQEAHQCGPAALASVLQYSGIELSPGTLLEHLLLPARKGSLQAEILATTRTHGRMPYIIEPDLATLIGELRNNQPVLVLQNLGFDLYPVWHYAVVIGFDPATGQFILRSGRQSRQRMSWRRFQQSWEASANWGITVLLPGQMPAKPDHKVYLAAAADLEAVGQHHAAREAFLAARNTWPDSPDAWLGLANSEYALQQRTEAEGLYRQLLARFPDYAIAYNNLASLLAERQCLDEALQLVRTGIGKLAKDSPLWPDLQATEQEIMLKQAHSPSQITPFTCQRAIEKP